MENRRSRDSFTKSLKRICQRIDGQRVFEADWKHFLLPGSKHSRLRVKAVWVVGSYARGAIQCGDLDLVADVIAEKGGLPPTSTISRCVICRAPDVRLYVGTPEENTSGVEFPEAKRVWSSEAPDWNAAIEAIPVDPTATRFERPHDMLPLRKEQIVDYGEDDLFEKIIGLLDQRKLASEWVPLTDIVVKPENWSYEATDFFEGVQRWCGKKTQEVMPYIIEWCSNNRYDVWHRKYNEKTCFKIGGAEVCVGRPYIDLRLLDSLSCSATLIVPHRSRRGPNGLWILSRGANHPLVQQFAVCNAYYLAYGSSPSLVQEINGWRSIHYLELFLQRKQAVVRQKELEEDDDMVFDIANIAERDLLSLISTVDLVEIDSVRYAITREGQFFEEIDKVVTAEEIASVFTK